MKKALPPQARVRGFAAMAGCLTAVALASCELTGPSDESFVIRVDSLAAPNVVAANETVTARFYGHIGPTGCWRLAGVDKQITAASLDVTFHGEHRESGGSECTQAPVALDYAAVVAPPVTPPFTITVHQPDGSLLRQLVTVQ